MSDTTFKSEVQAPLVPQDVSFTGFQFIQLDIKAITDGDLSFLSGDGFKAAITIMAQSWRETPAASLPDDDKRLAAFAGFGRGSAALADWEAVKDEALSDFTLCADGRWYSRTLAPKAVEAWKSVEKRKAQTEAARQARADTRQAPRTTTASVTESVTDAASEDATGSATTSATASREDERRSEERIPDQTGSDGIGADGKAPLHVRPRTQGDFQGKLLTLTSIEVRDLAHEFGDLPNILKDIAELEPGLSRIPSDKRKDKLRGLLRARTLNRQMEDLDLPL